MSNVCLFVALIVVAVRASNDGFVIGAFTGENSSLVLRSQAYGSAATPLAISCLNNNQVECVVVSLWVDEVSRSVYYVTRSRDGSSGSIVRGGQYIWQYQGSISGSINGFSGSRSLNSPSVYYVWNPTASTSPPFNSAPALFRIPLLGGIPEVVTLHAVLCSQMTIIDTVLYCLSSTGKPSMYSNSIAKPNSAFTPTFVTMMSPIAFVASREHVLFVLSGTDGRIYRSDTGESREIAVANFSSLWSPTLYNEPTNRFTCSVNGQVVQIVGMESVWNWIKDGVVGLNNGTTLGATALNVIAFSCAVKYVVQWMVVLFALFLV
jgi:hypothetical protein